jgi:hypothetical protein
MGAAKSQRGGGQYFFKEILETTTTNCTWASRPAHARAPSCTLLAPATQHDLQPFVPLYVLRFVTPDVLRG